MSAPRKRLGTTWLAGCSGCHMSFLDIDERILDLAKIADIVKCPIVDAKEFPPVDIALVEGAVASDQHLEEIRHIRRQSTVLVSFGDCAVTGNVSALRNFYPKDHVLKHSYVDMISNENGRVPEDDALQKLRDRVQPLHEVVKVDYYLAGCPPSADLIFHVLYELVHDRVPDPARENLIKYG